MMRMRGAALRLGVALVVGAGMAGCQKKEPVQQEKNGTLRPGICQTNDVDRSYQELPPDGVLVQVGNRALTRTLFQEGVDEYIALRAKSGPRTQQQDETKLERQAFDYVFANFMARAAMLEEAQTRAIVPGEADLADAERFVSQLCKRLRIKKADLAARLSGGEAAVSLRIREEATLKALLRTEFGKAFEVTDAEVQEVKARLERRAKIASATNQLFRAELSRVREQAISGKLKLTAPAEALKAALPADVTYSGVVTNSAFAIVSAQTVQTLAALKPGEWSPIVEAEESFEFYQLLSVTPNEDKELNVYTYVAFSAPRDLGWEVPELGQLKRDMSVKRRKDLQAPWVRGLMVKAGILYPNGIHLFKKVDEKKPANDRKAKARRTGGKEEK